jgi:Tfp pilus assembly protein PilZ
MAIEDKRESERFNREAPVIIKVENNGNQFDGRMYNYSRGGMYFESDASLRPGTEINIMVENSGNLPFKSPCRAKVKWCDEIQGAVVLYNFGIGVQYDLPITLAKHNGILKVIQGGAGQAQDKK